MYTLEEEAIRLVIKAFEGQKRMEKALKGAAELKKYVDSLIIIPNEKSFKRNNR